MMPQLTTEKRTSVHSTTCTTGPVPSSRSATPIVPGPPNSWGIPLPLHLPVRTQPDGFRRDQFTRWLGRGQIAFATARRFGPRLLAPPCVAGAPARRYFVARALRRQTIEFDCEFGWEFGCEFHCEFHRQFL